MARIVSWLWIGDPIDREGVWLMSAMGMTSEVTVGSHWRSRDGREVEIVGVYVPLGDIQQGLARCRNVETGRTSQVSLSRFVGRGGYVPA